MGATQASSDHVSGLIERCAAALGDRARLKQELAGLRDAAEARAHFARALFQLELARTGDPEARSAIPAVADALLIFWRDGSGDALAQSHPSLPPLWVAAASLLISFEMKRFDKALHDCWAVRGDAVRLKVAMDGLQPDDNQRVEFARCLYHLELARLGHDGSRAEFARRVGLLSEAYQSARLADELVGGDAGLGHLWSEVKPYLEEFFESLEEQATPRQEPTRRVHIGDVSPRTEYKTDPALRQLGDAPPSTSRFGALAGEALVTPTGKQPAMGVEAELVPPTGEAPALGAEPLPMPRTVTGERPVPSFSALVHHNPALVTRVPTAPQHPTPSLAPAPPPVGAAPPPPPPPQSLADFSMPTPPAGEVEILEADEAPSLPPPPPPAITPARGFAAAVEVNEDIDLDEEPDEATLAFWDYTFASLQLAPVEGLKSRMLATETRADRKRLGTYVDALDAHAAVPEAKAFGCLVQLLLAAETKEKSLFGQPNPRRQEALTAAFALLAPTPAAAGKAAVWFELDGRETETALHRGLDLLVPFLAFCSRHRLDPTTPAAAARYFAR